MCVCMSMMNICEYLYLYLPSYIWICDVYRLYRYNSISTIQVFSRKNGLRIWGLRCIHHPSNKNASKS